MDSDCNVMVVIVYRLSLLYRYTVIENADKTVGGKFSRSVEKTHNFFTGGVRLYMCDLSAHLDSRQRWNPIGTLAQRIMGDGRRSCSEFLFFKVEQKSGEVIHRADMHAEAEARKKKKSN